MRKQIRDMDTTEFYNFIAESLQGTCDMKVDGIRNGIYNYHSEKSLEQPTEEQLEEWVEQLDNSTEFDNYLDNELFLCSTDGWWYELCEQAEDGENCEDCYEAQNDEEE